MPYCTQTIHNTPQETNILLSPAFSPSRLGHATFLNNDAKDQVLMRQLPIEICLSSNLMYVVLLVAMA
jgi:adenosine deaminase